MICLTDMWDMAYEDENFERVFGRRKQVQDSLAFGKQLLEGTHNTWQTHGTKNMSIFTVSKSAPCE